MPVPPHRIGGGPNGCVRVTMFEWLPLAIQRGPYNGGISVDVIKMVAKANGFCLQFMRPPDGLSGLQLPNGTWIGMIGQINRTDADMSGTPIFTTEPRERMVDFSVALYTQEHRIMYLTPKPEPNIAGFMLPFTPLVWLISLAMMIAITLIIMVLFFLYDSIYDMWGRDQHNAYRITQSAREEPGWRAFHFVVGQVLGQAPEWDPNPSAVILFTTCLWMWVALIWSTLYRSNLQSLIIIPRTIIPFDTIEQLVAQNKYKIVMSLGGSLQQKAMEAPPESLMGQLLMKALVTADVDYAFKLLNTGQYGAIGNEIQLDSIHQQTFTMFGECKHTITKTGFVTGMQMAFSFQKGSPLKKMFDKTINHLKEGGILDFMLRRALSKASLCKIKQGNSSDLRALAFWDVAGMMSLFLGGLVISVIAFLVELYLGRGALAKIRENTLPPSLNPCKLLCSGKPVRNEDGSKKRTEE